MSDWIDVREQLPENPCRKVIVWVHGCYWPSYMHVGTFDGERWDVGDSRVNGFLGWVAYWMDMPERPNA